VSVFVRIGLAWTHVSLRVSSSSGLPPARQNSELGTRRIRRLVFFIVRLYYICMPSTMTQYYCILRRPLAAAGLCLHMHTNDFWRFSTDEASLRRNAWAWCDVRPPPADD
jgi:hypothetical protein